MEKRGLFIICFLFLILIGNLISFVDAQIPPVLNFQDIESGSATGNSDPYGNGAIVTIWGSNLGSSQGTSQVYFRDSSGTIRQAGHVYYWKNADGQLPGGPAN